MKKFYYNLAAHTFEKKDIPSFKEWCDDKDVEMPNKGSMKEMYLLDSYKKALAENFPTYRYMDQEIRVMNLYDKKIIFELFVDEDEGIVHIMDLNLEGTTPITEVVSDSVFQHLYEDKPASFQRSSWYDYRYFIYSKDGIVSEWRHDKLWFEKHYDVQLKQ